MFWRIISQTRTVTRRKCRCRVQNLVFAVFISPSKICILATHRKWGFPTTKCSFYQRIFWFFGAFLEFRWINEIIRSIFTFCQRAPSFPNLRKCTIISCFRSFWLVLAVKDGYFVHFCTLFWFLGLLLSAIIGFYFLNGALPSEDGMISLDSAIEDRIRILNIFSRCNPPTPTRPIIQRITNSLTIR